jgi:hypothetical protein
MLLGQSTAALITQATARSRNTPKATEPRSALSEHYFL